MIGQYNQYHQIGMGTLTSNEFVPKENTEEDSTHWKGKPSKFFIMQIDNEQQANPSNPRNFKMNDEQWNFVYRYYPEYGSAPYDLMVWLHEQAT